MTETLAGRVRGALDTVLDPCSIATRRPLSIVELGLVVAVDAEPCGDVRVVLRATSPSCTLIASILEAAERRIAALEGVGRVQLELDAGELWSPELMTPAGRAKLDAARAQARARIRPLATHRSSACP